MGPSSFHRMNQTLNSSKTPASNWSGPPGETLGVTTRVLSALTILTCVVGIAGNGMVICLLSFREQRGPFCVYILHLAVADLLFLLCLASELILEASLVANTGHTIYSDHTVHMFPTVLKAFEVLRRMNFLAYTVGLSLLTAISMERCLSVLFPIWYRCHRPQHLSAMVCALLWALAVLLNVIEALFCREFWNLDTQQCFTVDLIFSLLILALFTPVMALSSFILSVRVQRSFQRRRRQPTRLYVAILASVLVFLTCALPLGIYWCLLYWLDRHLWTDIKLSYSIFFSSSVSSGANPIIYFVVGRRRSPGPREALGTVLRRALQEEAELEPGDTPSTGTNQEGV
nr:mas-related G-protein coupled receptor member D [Vicugna pacos]